MGNQNNQENKKMMMFGGSQGFGKRYAVLSNFLLRIETGKDDLLMGQKYVAISMERYKDMVAQIKESSKTKNNNRSDVISLIQSAIEDVEGCTEYESPGETTVGKLNAAIAKLRTCG